MAKKHEVIVDTERCIGCGLCVRDCVAGAVSLTNGKAGVNLTGCIACGHCEAICPQAAVTLTGFQEESEAFEEQVRLDPQQLLMAIKTRRTLRVFKERQVAEEILDKIIEAGRLAPTGGNAQNTGYIVLGTKQKECEAQAVSMFRKIATPAGKVLPFLKSMNIDDNFFFKKAPLVIVITGNAVNASLAAENMAFMAEACGLGVLFSGFYTMCANRSRKLRTIMQMQRGEKAVTTLVIGYPGVRYQRTAKREAAKVRKL